MTTDVSKKSQKKTGCPIDLKARRIAKGFAKTEFLAADLLASNSLIRLCETRNEPPRNLRLRVAYLRALGLTEAEVTP